MSWKRMDYAGWGRVHRASGEVARPERASALEALLAEGIAPAFGARRSYGDAALNDGGRAIDMSRMDRIIDFDPYTGVVEVEAGLAIGELLRIMAPQGWIPAVVPGTGLATVGGCIAQDVHGKNHHEVGSFGAHVTRVTLVQGAERLHASPARNKALFRATMGGLGQTGVIVAARLQLLPTPGTAMEVTETRADDWDAFIEALDAARAPYVVGWIDATAKGRALGRGIVETARLTEGEAISKSSPRSVPFDAPGVALSPPVVKVFNEGYYRRIPESGRTRRVPIQEMLFPLDRIHDWNRLYGKRGFHQFQCVVPVDAAPALREMLALIARSGLASPLAVLKRMGPGRAGMMSFPMEGYTLAVDFPNREKAVALIGELEARCVGAGGRIYLAKDALATGGAIKAMYPEWQDWAAEAAKADPDGALATDMIRRLELRSTT